MNIRDYWPTFPEVKEVGPAVNSMLNLRRDTYTGFARIESEKGFLKPHCSIHTSQGQEMVRLLCFRVLEEIAESIEASDPDHVKEEAVDAMNYLLAILVLDPEAFSPERYNVLLTEAVQDIRQWGQKLSTEDLGRITYNFGSKLGDFLRNRSWMNNTQDPYFSGFDVMETLITETAKLLIATSESFDEFYRYYVAKDSVLQFRLKSKY